ncbi:MAG: N-acetylmuramoyl-L-alanine amidase [Beijerinckiaceae bacterium]
MLNIRIRAISTVGAALLVLAAASGHAGAIDWQLRKPSVSSAQDPGSAGSAIGDAILKPVIFRLQASRKGKVSRLELTATKPLQADAFLLAKPDRAIIDLPGVLFQLEDGNKTPSPAGVIRTFRYGGLAGDKSRIVVDLAAPAIIAKVSTVKIASTVFRLRVDLEESSASAFQNEAAKGKREAAAKALPASKAAKEPSGNAGGLPVIVIDPGHGGVDSGTRGFAEQPEKEIVLAFAKALAQKIDKTGRFKAQLTRNGDIFVPLRERMAIAQRANAKLLISIHADSLREKYVGGATVYTISDRASDAAAARLAEKENKADENAGYSAPKDKEEVSDILFDLTRRETRAFSHVFARSLVSYWQKSGKLNKNPHRSAGFIVLKAPDVPSVLLEMGYLSNKPDAAQLSDPRWREKAAANVVGAIEAFFSSRRPQAAEVVPGQTGASKKLAESGKSTPN